MSVKKTDLRRCSEPNTCRGRVDALANCFWKEEVAFYSLSGKRALGALLPKNLIIKKHHWQSMEGMGILAMPSQFL